MIISQYPQVNGIPLYQTSNINDNITDVGQRFQIDGGAAEVVLVQAGAVDIAPGILVQSPAVIAADQALTVTAYFQNEGNVSAATVTATAGGAVLSNQYQNGSLFVVSGAGAGQKLTIRSNTAVTVGNPLLIEVDVPSVALDTSSVVSLFPNPFAGVIINPASGATNSPVGISFYTIPAGTFGYVATRGEWLALNQGGTTAGAGLTASVGVDGALMTSIAGSAQVASATVAGVDATYNVVNVSL